MRTLFFMMAVMLSLAINAKPRTNTAKALAAKSAINTMRSPRPKMAHAATELKVLRETEALTVLGYDGGFFAIVSNDDLMPEVLAVSDAKFSDGENPGLKWWMNAMNMVGQEIVRRGEAPKAVPKPAEFGYASNVDAIVKAEWDQDAPYWDMCPTKSGRTALTGCVATALSQVLYTHKTPVNGHGSRTNNSWSSVTFNYEGYVPDYDNMIDKYTSGPNAGQYTQQQVEPMAKLMLACGVAANMDYSPEGSGAFTDQARDGLVKYMGIETADFKERDYYNDRDWMDMVYKELDGGHAMYYSAVDSDPWTGGGHAFVCDGYDETGKVHINWGWAGSDNGLYNIDLLNPAAYQFSMYQDFIQGLWDPNDSPGQDLINKTVETTEAGQLQMAIGTEEIPRVKMLKVIGPIDDNDVALIRKMASGTLFIEGETEEENQYGHLRQLDLSNALLDIVPEEAFKDAVLLRSVSLPRSLTKISSKAFQGCSALTSIRSYTYAVPAMGTKVFDGVNGSSLSAMLIAGSSESYLRNAQWKTIITKDNVSEFGTCVKAGNKSVYYGSQAPKLSYTVVGESVSGKPELSTDYSETSGVGKYAITVSRGTIDESPNLIFVDGAITVMKVELSVKAVDATREQYQPNPVFTLTYDGFKNDDTEENAFTVLPEASTTATEDSPIGVYPISVTGGEAPNYKLSYVAGELTVTASTGIEQIADRDDKTVVYDLQGRKVSTLYPGSLYIIRGMKYVAK